MLKIDDLYIPDDPYLLPKGWVWKPKFYLVVLGLCAVFGVGWWMGMLLGGG